MEIGKGVQQSLELYSKSFTTLFLAGLVAMLLSLCTIGILAGPLLGGFIVLCLKLFRGEPGEFNEIFAHFDKFGPTFTVTILYIIAIIVLRVFIFIPYIGVLFGIIAFILSLMLLFVYFFAIAYIVEKNMQPLEALEKGWSVFMANPFMNWAYVLVFMILSCIGLIGCFIGVLMTMPFLYIGMTFAYRELTAE